MYDEYFTGSALYLAIYIAFYFNWSHVSSLAFDLVFVFSLHLSFVLPRLSSVLLYSSFCHDFHLSLTLSFALFHFICFLLFLIRFFVHLCFCPLPCLLSRLSSKHFNVISKLLLGWYDGTASYNVKSIMKQRCIRQC